MFTKKTGNHSTWDFQLHNRFKCNQMWLNVEAKRVNVRLSKRCSDIRKKFSVEMQNPKLSMCHLGPVNTGW